ncbi:putative nuclease HARBI1 [Epinephelus moara]|uniref:putative nuclease HARBI1 n=1 Tax=Epinephelus moara TaxID=300413 RepID=UPI00214E9838|nr:putative nuclease HARBI1 [Epinephelus moara]
MPHRRVLSALRRRSARHLRYRMMLAIDLGLFSDVASRGPYCRVNPNVPLLRLYFNGGDTRKDFRVSRESLESLIQLVADKDHGWEKSFEVLVFVFWLACGTSYRVVSEAFDIPRTTCHDMIHRVSKVIRGVFRRLIRFPDMEELEEIGAGFQQLSGCPAFCRVAGSIDGCHVRIVPPRQFAGDYFNRKLFHSIQFQAICDHKGRFLDVVVGFPGCVHEARVLRSSPFHVHQLYPPPGWYLIGDGGYPCLAEPICLLTGFREPVRNAVEGRYNARLSRARCVVERAFGVLKTRWRSIFLKALEVKVEFVPEVITACLFLHNLCISNGDILEPEPVEEEEEDGGDGDGGEGHEPVQWSGDTLRNRLAAAVSAPRDRVPVLQEHDYC